MSVFSLAPEAQDDDAMDDADTDTVIMVTSGSEDEAPEAPVIVLSSDSEDEAMHSAEEMAPAFAGFVQVFCFFNFGLQQCTFATAGRSR